MPRPKQKYYKVPKDKTPKGRGGEARWALQVVRIRGPKKGDAYVRTFKTEAAMRQYMQRHTAGGAQSDEAYVGHFRDATTAQKKVKKRTFLKDLKGWIAEGLGLEKMSGEEKEYLRAFKEEVGRNPRPWEDPYLVERSGKFVDKVFTAMTVTAGPGLALQGVKAAVAGTKLATQSAARAATKSAFKKAIKKTASELVKKDTVKGTLKRAAKGGYKVAEKGFDASHKVHLVEVYSGMASKAANNVFGR